MKKSTIGRQLPVASSQLPVLGSQSFRARSNLRGLLLSYCFLRHNRYSVYQELRARNHHFVAWFHAVEHYIIVSDDLANLEWLLVDYISAFLIGFRDECEIHTADARHG